MLKAGGRVPFLLRFGRWICTCLPQQHLDEDMRARIRPVMVGWLACWCDRSPARREED
jgi:hypothetical protein